MLCVVLELKIQWREHFSTKCCFKYKIQARIWWRDERWKKKKENWNMKWIDGKQKRLRCRLSVFHCSKFNHKIFWFFSIFLFYFSFLIFFFFPFVSWFFLIFYFSSTVYISCQPTQYIELKQKSLVADGVMVVSAVNLGMSIVLVSSDPSHSHHLRCNISSDRVSYSSRVSAADRQTLRVIKPVDRQKDGEWLMGQMWRQQSLKWRKSSLTKWNVYKANTFKWLNTPYRTKALIFNYLLDIYSTRLHI